MESEFKADLKHWKHDMKAEAKNNVDTASALISNLNEKLRTKTTPVSGLSAAAPNADAAPAAAEFKPGWTYQHFKSIHGSSAKMLKSMLVVDDMNVEWNDMKQKLFAGDKDANPYDVAVFRAFESKLPELESHHSKIVTWLLGVFEKLGNSYIFQVISEKIMSAAVTMVKKALEAAQKIARTANPIDPIGTPMATTSKIASQIHEVAAKKRPAVGEPGAGSSTISPTVEMRRAEHPTVVDATVRKGWSDSLDGVLEYDKKPVKHTETYNFENWGQTVHNTPFVVFEPTTKTGCQNIVKWAKQHGSTVRGAGFRHTWTNMYSADNQVLVSMIPIELATNTRRLFPHPPVNPIPNGLSYVKALGQKTPEGKNLIEIGAATTNDQFRQWCLTDGEGQGNWKYTLPLNVIMVEITFGGSNAPICHGAGLDKETLSDLVHSIEFVNPNGDLQVVSDKTQLRAAAGAFGLLGIVTSITFALPDMAYASMKPDYTPVPQSIPPMDINNVPKLLQKGWNKANYQQDIAAFEEHCKTDYYAEWFWFAFQDAAWNNTWKTIPGDHKKDSQLVTKWVIFRQSLLGSIAEALNPLVGLSGWLQTKLIGLGARMNLPNPDKPTIAPVIEGLHFLRGIHAMRVVDMELEIEIPARKDGTADWDLVRKAWWDATYIIFEHKAKGKYPCRLALEMRVMGGSKMFMAPQAGNSLGTCSIEVVSALQVPEQEWYEFMQEISDKWHSYTDLNGRPLVVRSHWCKQWETLRLGPNKVPAIDHYRDVVYREGIRQFKEQLGVIAAADGKYTVSDLQDRFSNETLDQLFFTDPAPLPNNNH